MKWAFIFSSRVGAAHECITSSPAEVRYLSAENLFITTVITRTSAFVFAAAVVSFFCLVFSHLLVYGGPAFWSHCVESERSPSRVLTFSLPACVVEIKTRIQVTVRRGVSENGSGCTTLKVMQKELCDSHVRRSTCVSVEGPLFVQWALAASAAAAPATLPVNYFQVTFCCF